MAKTMDPTVNKITKLSVSLQEVLEREEFGRTRLMVYTKNPLELSDDFSELVAVKKDGYLIFETPTTELVQKLSQDERVTRISILSYTLFDDDALYN